MGIVIYRRVRVDESRRERPYSDSIHSVKMV